jgi:hypothetical protein
LTLLVTSAHISCFFIFVKRKERSKTEGGPAPPGPTQAEENITNALKDTASFKGIDGGLESSFIEIQVNLSKI